MNGRPCPICGETEFKGNDTGERCHVCGWYDDAYQERHPNDPRGINKISLNDYKRRYEESRK